MAVQYFMTDNKINVNGIILATVAEFTTELNKPELTDPVRNIFFFLNH